MTSPGDDPMLPPMLLLWVVLIVFVMVAVYIGQAHPARP